VKGNAIPLQAWTGPEGSRRLRLTRFQDSRNMKVERLSALRTGHLYPPGNISGTHFCQRLSRSQDHSAAGRIMSVKNFIGTIGNRTRHLPACSAVPQPSPPPRAATHEISCMKYFSDGWSVLKTGPARRSAWQRIEDLIFYTAEVRVLMCFSSK
jgi:hypothetical protein